MSWVWVTGRGVGGLGSWEEGVVGVGRVKGAGPGIPPGRMVLKGQVP